MANKPQTSRVTIGVGLTTGLGALAAGLLLANPVVAAIGGSAFLISLTAGAIRGRKKTPRAAVIHGMPDPETIKDEETRNAVKKILANKAALQKVIDETPQDVLTHMTKTLDSLDELERYAVRLVERAEDIHRHLSKVNLPALVTEVKQLATRASSAKDAEARESFDDAKDARMDEIRALKELRATKERIDANLMRVVAVLGALPTKVVHMRALDAQAMDQLSGDMSDDLAAVGKELETSERVIKQQLVAE
jgi:hypothetical protein